MAIVKTLRTRSLCEIFDVSRAGVLKKMKAAGIKPYAIDMLKNGRKSFRWARADIERYQKQQVEIAKMYNNAEAGND